jgi:SAM-dependent methyltransferase
VTVERFKRAETRHGKGTGHPILFGLPEAEFFGDFPDGGGYPRGFLQRAFAIMGVTDPAAVLHVCSGSMKIGVRVDIRPEMNPTVVADACNLPFAADAFEFVMADPPYSREYAANLYGTGDVYPDPHKLVNECLRVLKPGGRLGFMHHIVPKFRKPGRILKVHTITQGVGYNVRAWSLFTKDGGDA